MTSFSTFARAAELVAADRPFTVATVVAVRKPTSARPGASGIVHPDGPSKAGSGARAPSRSSSARRCVRSPTANHGCCACRGRSERGPTRGWRHRAGHDLPLRRHAGDLRGTACARAAAVGRRHDAHRRRAGATRVGRRLAGDGGRSGGRSRRVRGAERVHASADIRGLDPEAAPYVVVASQGIWDEEAVGLALTRDAVYVGLVASPTRGRRRPRVAARGDDHRRRARRRAAGPRRARPRAPRRPRRSPCRSSPSSSRSATVGRTSSRRPARRPSPAGCPSTSPSNRSSTTSCSSTRCAA